MKKSVLSLSIFILILSSFFIQDSVTHNQDFLTQPGNLQNTPEKLSSDQNWGNIPLYFIPNKGQFEKRAQYYSRTPAYTLWVTKTGLVFDSKRHRANRTKRNNKIGFSTELKKVERDISRLIFRNANTDTKVITSGKTKTKINYMVGNRKNWKTGIQTSPAVLYKELYSGIDLKVYGVNRQIEYDFLVKSGADVSDIRIFRRQ